MVATLNVLQPSTEETSYYAVYFNIIIAGQITASSSTQITLGVLPGPGVTPSMEQMELVLNGTGFTFDAMGDVTGGTITEVQFFNELGYIAQLTGYPISAAELYDAFQAVRTNFDLDPIFDILYNRVPYTVNGSEGGDYFGAASLDDLFFGNGGPDSLFGALGDDTIHGGSGNDRLSGGEGDDLIFGNTGNDVIIADTGNDTINGGLGTDYLSMDALSGSVSPITVDFAAGSIADAVVGDVRARVPVLLFLVLTADHRLQ